MAYATVEDLEARFGTISDAGERSIAAVLLGDAAVYLDSLVRVDPCDTHQANALMVVSCNMVHRAMQQSTALFGVQQATATMGPFTQTAQYANPSGGLYVSAAEKAMLGADGGYIGSIPARIEGWYGSNA